MSLFRRLKQRLPTILAEEGVCRVIPGAVGASLRGKLGRQLGAVAPGPAQPGRFRQPLEGKCSPLPISLAGKFTDSPGGDMASGPGPGREPLDPTHTTRGGPPALRGV